ncbi:MAG: hypothetical protein H8F28_13175 [Fibrella sp.]|nr:hypothetical protein [Armatimonadota bacterium]
MKRPLPLIISCVAVFVLLTLTLKFAQSEKEPSLRLIRADSPLIQYTGRIDFSDPKRPRFWAAGVYLRAKFKGTGCEIVVNDEMLWGRSRNFIEVVVDNGKPFRVQTNGKSNTITVAHGLRDGEHSVTICKDTEAGIGYLEFIGFRCAGLVPLPAKPKRKLEFIGDSITCSTGKENLTRIVNEEHHAGDRKVHAFFFSRGYNNGCGGHPDLSDHEQIAGELSTYLKTTMRW